MKIETGNSVVDAISTMRWEGDITPRSWYRHIKYTTAKGEVKVDRLAIDILSDFVYWHRAKPLRDELTGEECGWAKKFSGDKLHRATEALAETLGASVKCVRSSIKTLEKLGLVETERRPVRTQFGVQPNIMFVSLVPEAIAAITYRPQNRQQAEVLEKSLLPKWDTSKAQMDAPCCRDGEDILYIEIKKEIDNIEPSLASSPDCQQALSQISYPLVSLGASPTAIDPGSTTPILVSLKSEESVNREECNLRQEPKDSAPAHVTTRQSKPRKPKKSPEEKAAEQAAKEAAREAKRLEREAERDRKNAEYYEFFGSKERYNLFMEYYKEVLYKKGTQPTDYGKQISTMLACLRKGYEYTKAELIGFEVYERQLQGQAKADQLQAMAVSVMQNQSGATTEGSLPQEAIEDLSFMTARDRKALEEAGLDEDIRRKLLKNIRLKHHSLHEAYINDAIIEQEDRGIPT